MPGRGYKLSDAAAAYALRELPEGDNMRKQVDEKRICADDFERPSPVVKLAYIYNEVKHRHQHSPYTTAKQYETRRPNVFDARPEQPDDNGYATAY